MRGRLWPVLCVRWRLSTALFRWMPDRFPFSVPGGLFVRRPSFPFRFRPSFPGLPFRIVISLVFSQPVGAPSFPCLPGFHLIYMRCFHVWLLVHLPCFPCCASSVQLYPSFLSRYLLLFYSLCPSLLSLFCVRLLTHALYFPCVSFVPNSLSSCCSLPSFLSPSLGFPFPLCFFCVFFVRVFSLVAPTFPVPFPLFPAAFPSSSSFVPAFSFPFSPFLLSPSSSIYKKVPS